MLKDLHYKVYDDVEALRNGDMPIWHEAVQAKKAGKPYDHADWDVFLGRYDAIVTHLATPFAEELTDKKNHPLAKVIVITKSPSASVGDRARAFLANQLFPLIDPWVFGYLAHIKYLVGNRLLDYDCIRARLGPQQDLIAVDDFDRETICTFLGNPVPQGLIQATESLFIARLRYVEEYIGRNYVHPLNLVLIAVSIAMAAMLAIVTGPLVLRAIVAVFGILIITFLTTSPAPAETKTAIPPSALVPPHLRKKATLSDEGSQKITLMPAPAATATTPTPYPASVPPHLRRKKIAAPSKGCTQDSPSRTPDAPVTPPKVTSLKADTAAFVPHQLKTGAPVPNKKSHPVSKPGAPNGQKQTRPARSYQPKSRGRNNFTSTQLAPSISRPARTMLKGWVNVETSIRQDDIKVRNENDAKAEALKDKEPGVWTEKFGSRLTKAAGETKEGYI